MLEWLTQHYIEIFGAVTGIIFVFLEIRQNIWLWPVGIISSAVYIWVFFAARFYADMGLQVYYLSISFYGWYWWKRGGEKVNSLEVSRTGKNLALKLLVLFLILNVLLWYVLKYFTDSPVPVGDSFTTALSIIATWMLARKLLEHWILWIIVDSVSIGLYIYKGLYPTVILFTLYTVMAIAGLASWSNEYRMKMKGYGA